MTESREDTEMEKQQCWVLMSRSEKVLLILLVITVILLVAALVAVAYLLITAQNVCETPSCIKASSHLLQTTDFAANPCEDFYRFTCGNYMPTNQECEEESRLRKDAVVGVLTDDSDSDSLKIAKQFYQACSDVTEENSNSTLLSLINKIGGWPLLLGQKWRENGFEWLNFMADLRSLGFKYDWFIRFDYYEDTDGKNLLLITPPDLKPISPKYLESMVSVSAKLGSSSTFAWNDMQKVLDFQHELANISHVARQKLLASDESEHISKETVQKLDTLWPEVKLVEVLNRLAGGFARFDNSTTIATAGKYYIYELNLLLRTTPKRTQANYIIWKIIESYLPFCSENFRQIYAQYSDLPDREDHCLTETIKRFYSGLEIYVSTKQRNDEIRESVKGMTDLIKEQIGEVAADVEVKIVGIDNPSIAESHGVIEMINEINLWSENAFYNCLHKKFTVCSKEGYHSDPRHLEIYFDVTNKSIDIPFVLLHSDWYRWDQPNYINYARLGRTLGDVFIDAIRQMNKRLEDEGVTGVELAYRSYIQWTRDEGKERRLPAISNPVNQLFWIHSSSMYCSSTNDSRKFDEVTNSSDFSTDFNCENCIFCVL